MTKAPALTLGLMRSPRFDSMFVLGCAIVALASGVLATIHPEFLWDRATNQPGWILWADIWLLGSQHVIATYTRLCFDKASFKEHWFLVLGLPWLVIAGVLAAICWTGTCAVVTTTYLYWQWFHYTRQSYGVHRIYARKAPAASIWDDRVAAWMLYAVPLWGILYRSWEKTSNPAETFLFKPFWALPTQEWEVTLVGYVALALCTAWILRQASLYVDGKVSITHSAYLLSHLAVFVAGYYLIPDITCGWLVLNVWHNAQYIMIVWMYNNNRFKSGIDPNSKVLSYLSQRGRVLLYLGAMMVITVLFYHLLDKCGQFFHNFGLLEGDHDPSRGGCSVTGPVIVVLYQAVNFHHYLVDGFIWKVRRKQNQQRLGIAPAANSAEAAVEAVVN